MFSRFAATVGRTHVPSTLLRRSNALGRNTTRRSPRFRGFGSSSASFGSTATATTKVLGYGGAGVGCTLVYVLAGSKSTHPPQFLTNFVNTFSSFSSATVASCAGASEMVVVDSEQPSSQVLATSQTVAASSAAVTKV
jgi:hypothetical protein